MGGFSSLNNSNGCKRCHFDAQVDTVSSHLPFRITSGNKHYRRDCVRYHTQMQGPPKAFASNFTINSCRDCHSANKMNDKHQGEVNGYTGYGTPPDDSANCLACHDDGRKP